MTDYTDFVIQIGPPVDGFHSVTVLQSSQGTGGSGKFPAASIEALVAGSVTGFAAGGARSITLDDARTSAPVLEPEEIGRTLHDLLFTGEIARLFDRSLGDALAKGRRLRVRLHLNVENASVAPLARLPWELMYRHERREYLVLSTQTTLVRSLDVPIMQYEQRPITGPLRVLFVMSNPRGDLNLAAERAAIEAQLAKEAPVGAHTANRRALETEFLENATFAGLEELLNDKEFHIIHFMGHGDFDAQHQGLLLFHDGARSAIVPAPRVARTEASRRWWAALLQQIFEVDPLACLTGHGTMRLVACITQRSVIDQIRTHLRTRTPTAARSAPSTRAPGTWVATGRSTARTTSADAPELRPPAPRRRGGDVRLTRWPRTVRYWRETPLRACRPTRPLRPAAERTPPTDHATRRRGA